MIAHALVSLALAAATAPSGGVQRIQDEGTSLPARTKVNFTGSSVTCADNAGANRTDCTVTGGSPSTLPRPGVAVPGQLARRFGWWQANGTTTPDKWNLTYNVFDGNTPNSFIEDR